MQIVQISDSHIALPEAGGSDRIGDLRRYVDHIKGLGRQPDFVVHTGDIVHDGTQAEYAEAAGILEELHTRLYVIPGNRDDRGGLRAAFARRLPEDCHQEFIQYSVMNDGLCAIMLDTVSTRSNKGQLCSTRLDHLDRLLGDAGDRPVVVFMHHPPFEVTEAAEPFRFQFEDRDCLTAFSDILSRHRNVRHIYCGHSHRAARGRFAGITASIVPSVAVDLRMGPPVGDGEVCPVYDLAGQHAESLQQTS